MLQDQGKDKQIKTLFNVVISPANLKDGNIYEMIDVASKTFDNAVLNLYPGHQFNGPPVFKTKADAEAYGDLVDYMLTKQKEQMNDPMKKFTPRMGFWFSQEVPFMAGLSDKELLDALNNGIWSCIDAAETGPYIQAGRDEKSITVVPGLKPACLWKDTITTSSMQVNTATPEKIAGYIINLPNTKAPCRCEMPRLEADGVRTQRGLARNEKYNEIFTNLRQEHLGF